MKKGWADLLRPCLLFPEVIDILTALAPPAQETQAQEAGTQGARFQARRPWQEKWNQFR